MGRFNYFFNTPVSNPAGEVEKQTNEIPSKMKAKTAVKKKGVKKAGAKIKKEDTQTK